MAVLQVSMRSGLAVAQRDVIVAVVSMSAVTFKAFVGGGYLLKGEFSSCNYSWLWLFLASVAT